jgi:hypothetical protein
MLNCSNKKIEQSFVFTLPCPAWCTWYYIQNRVSLSCHCCKYPYQMSTYTGTPSHWSHTTIQNSQHIYLCYVTGNMQMPEQQAGGAILELTGWNYWAIHDGSSHKTPPNPQNLYILKVFQIIWSWKKLSQYINVLCKFGLQIHDWLKLWW